MFSPIDTHFMHSGGILSDPSTHGFFISEGLLIPWLSWRIFVVSSSLQADVSLLWRLRSSSRVHTGIFAPLTDKAVLELEVYCQEVVC